MAAGDPPVPTDPTLANLNAINDVAPKTAAVLNDVNSSMGKTSEHTDEMTQKIKLSANELAFLTVGFLGAQTAMQNFGGVKTDNLNTLNNQLTSLTDVLKKPGPAAEMAKAGVMALLKAVDPSSVGGGLTAFAKNGADGLIEYAKVIVGAIDYHHQLQSSMMSVAASNGDLNAFYGRVGENLEHINQVSERQEQIMQQAFRTSGYTLTATKEFAGQLLRIPGAFEEMQSGTDAANNSVAILTKSLLVARGAGLDTAAMAQLMKQAYYNLGLDLDRANEFAARAGEIASKYKLQVDDVTSALMKSSEAFIMFTTNGEHASSMTTGLQEVMAEYINSLKNVGVPGQQAINIATNMAKAVGDMSIAQKSFLSGRTGGPGGLMGGFQIENMLDEGPEGIKKVFAKVRQEMKRELGTEVTRERAGQSEMAARQYQKQLIFLQQGPLGKMAQTPAEAEKLQKAMFAGEGKLPEMQLADDANASVVSAVDRGTKWAERSNNNLARLVALGEETKANAGVTLTRTLDPLMGRAGGPAALQTVSMRENREMMDVRQATASSTDASKNVHDEFIDDYKNLTKDMPLAGKAFKDFMKGLAGETGIPQRDISQEVQTARQNKPILAMGPNPADYSTSGSQVAASARIAHAKAAADAKKGADTTGGVDPRGANTPAGGPVPVVLAAGSSMNINFTGTCIHCGNNIDTHVHATGAAAAIPKN
jgi:hypothetical protein